MFSAIAFVCFVILPTYAVSSVLVRWLEQAASRAEDRERMEDLVANASDIAMRIDNLEKIVDVRAGA